MLVEKHVHVFRNVRNADCRSWKNSPARSSGARSFCPEGQLLKCRRRGQCHILKRFCLTRPRCEVGEADLLAENQQSERLRNYFRPGMRILGSGSRWWSEFGGHRIYIVVLGVERHGSRSALRRDRLDHSVFVG